MSGRHPIVDAGSAVVVAGAFAHILPPMAAALGIVWYAINIWESATAKGLRARIRERWQRGLTVEDRVVAIFLGLGGAGVGLFLIGLSILTGMLRQ